MDDDTRIRLSDRAQRDLDEQFQLEFEAMDILDLVVAEWESTPVSVACFDLQMVKRAKYITKRIKYLKNGGF
jgi:hypothetical protein